MIGNRTLKQLYVYGLLAVWAVASMGCQTETRQQATLSVKLSGYSDTSGVYLDELRSRYVDFDTAKYVSDGFFQFDRPISKASFFRLRLANGQTLPIILLPDQPCILMANASNLKSNPSITDNTETQALFRANDLSMEFLNDIKRIESIFADTTREKPLQPEKDSLLAKIDTVFKQRKAAMKVLLDENATKLSVLPLLLQRAKNYSFFVPDSDRQLFLATDNFLIRQYGYQPQVKKFHYQLDSLLAQMDSLQGTRLGDPMPDPMAMTIWKEHLPISKFKGKPLLVFVWSSLNDDCEKEVPLFKNLWEKYNKVGLAVYMVSVDSTETIWQRAIDQYRLACIHANDLKGKASPIDSILGIRSIPACFLVNKDGIIVEKNIWGSQLEEAVDKLVHEK
jgi:peroxiredoxin